MHDVQRVSGEYPVKTATAKTATTPCLCIMLDAISSVARTDILAYVHTEIIALMTADGRGKMAE